MWLIMTFYNLSLHPQILKAVTEAGYLEPTSIQLEAIPKIMEGFDIRASAQTGTGKTAAFLLPTLNHLVTKNPKQGKGPRVLILVPTRELAMQITTQALKYSKYLNQIKTVCISGGVSYQGQMRDISRPYDILIATPGRLIEYIEKRKIDFSRLEILILDEADRMLDMGFVEPVEQIVAAIPSSRQTLLFSATMQGSVIKLSEKLLNKPIDINVNAKSISKNENITQKLHYVDDLNHKNRLLDHILSNNGDDCIDCAIVFTATKRHADQLANELHDKNHSVAALHGDMNQRQRTRTISQLRNGKIRVLVATDVAARGIDVQLITHVINFDLPNTVEDYVHRIGRTGRAGAKGIALSFAAGRDTPLVKKIEKFTGQQIDVSEIEGLEPRAKSQSRPKQRAASPRNSVNRQFGGRPKSQQQQKRNGRRG